MTDDQTPTERYQSFLDANNEASQLLLPQKEKKVVNDRTVQVMSEELKQRSEKFQLDVTEDNRISVQEGKQKLSDAYIAAQEQLLDSQVRALVRHSDQGGHAESWAMINTITGKIPSLTGKIRGNSPEEWVTKWRDHFSSFLRQPLAVENPDEDIEPIHGPLNISTDPFKPV